jgi:broad specificity phosphatase PhoE
MSTQLFLIRHGESTGNIEQRFTGWLDVPLTPRGEAQARACGKRLQKSGPFDAIYTSDLIRARETAFGIAKELPFDPAHIKITRNLREKSAGVFSGVNFEEAQRNHPDLWEALMQRRWDYALPEGESNQHVSERVKAFFDELLTTHKGQKIIIISHGITLSHILRQFLRIEEAQFPQWATFQSENTCIHRLLIREDGGCAVVSLNDTAHLETIE